MNLNICTFQVLSEVYPAERKKKFLQDSLSEHACMLRTLTVSWLLTLSLGGGCYLGRRMTGASQRVHALGAEISDLGNL
jgi:hypothetical protein